ncbi:MAG: transposase [Fimbriimonadaceae bacterium]|nr:transposase [Fimbriimonadaceae bacterium]
MKTWPHAPSKVVTHPGTYIITAATYHKLKLFDSAAKLDLLMDALFSTVEAQGWQLQAWAIFPNHYHLVGFSPEHDGAVRQLTKALHAMTAQQLNKIDGQPGRTVWYRSWDTRVTFERSYLARLAYVHNNPVKHGIVTDAIEYRWCSARWLQEEGDRPFVESVLSFDTSRVNVLDDF